MNTNKLCIGVDLGDRSFSVDAVKLFPAEISPVQLPGQRGNDPILSAVGERKDGSFELLRSGDSYNIEEFSDVFVNFKRRPSTTSGADRDHYEKGTQELLRLALLDNNTVKYIRNLADNCDEIKFCIGFPTSWTKKDVGILYHVINDGILGKSDLLQQTFGKPVRVTLERESTAAFIYARTFQKELGIQKKSVLMVLDFGSSTINVTALTIGEQNTKYNSGHNYFGGRMIDCILADYYIQQLTEQDRIQIEDLDRLNDGAASAMILLAASEVKENLNTSKAVRFVTDFSNKTVRISQEEFSKLLDQPMAQRVERFHLIPEVELSHFSNRNWRQILTDYLTEENNALQKAGITPDYVIATGGGAVLRDVRTISNVVFNQQVRFFDAADTTRVISRGLALSARRMEKSSEFRQEVDVFLTKRMPTLVRSEISSLASGVSERIADLIRDKAILPKMRCWREGMYGYSTLDATSNKIANYCASSEFEEQLRKDEKIQTAIRKWCEEKIGTSIAGELKTICDKYGVKGFTIVDLNVLKVPSINIGGSMASPILDAIANFIGIIAAIIAAAVSADALVLVLGIIALFLPELAGLVASIIAAIPGGLIILAGIAGVAVFRLIRLGWENFKDEIISNISQADIPVLFRKAITESSVKNSIDAKRDDTVKKIKTSITDGHNADKISRQISEAVGKQIQPKLDEILYALEVNGK